MEQFSNRVEQELIQFRSREERLGKLFPSEDKRDSSTALEKLKFFGYLLIKFKDAENPDELYLLKMLQIQKQKLEKELYPNRILLLLRRAFNFLAAEKRYADRLQQKISVNRDKLFDAVSRSGFQIPSEKILFNMESGKERFTIPVSNYVNEKQRMEHQLVFIKDSSGDYGFDGFKAALHDETNPGGFKEHFFKNDSDAFNAAEAFHLLAGRALEKGGIWRQFDLNDKNADGNYRIKEFRSDYGFELKNAIEAMPLKDKSADKTEELLQALKIGENRTAVFEVKEREQCFSMQANPQFKAVDLFDEHLKKINLSALRGRCVRNKQQKAGASKNARQNNKKAVRIQ